MKYLGGMRFIVARHSDVASVAAVENPDIGMAGDKKSG
jgi:hypothetical protein